MTFPKAEALALFMSLFDEHDLKRNSSRKFDDRFHKAPQRLGKLFPLQKIFHAGSKPRIKASRFWDLPNNKTGISWHVCARLVGQQSSRLRRTRLMGWIGHGRIAGLGMLMVIWWCAQCAHHGCRSATSGPGAVLADNPFEE